MSSGLLGEGGRESKLHPQRSVQLTWTDQSGCRYACLQTTLRDENTTEPLTLFSFRHLQVFHSHLASVRNWPRL